MEHDESEAMTDAGSVGVTNGAAERPKLGGAPKKNRNAEKSGHYRRKAQLEAISFDDLHGNSSGGIQLRERRRELIEHCGGPDHISAVTLRVIDRTVFTEYLLDHLDFYLAMQGKLIINRRTRSVIPVVADRNRTVQTLLNLYNVLGYQPTARPVHGSCPVCHQDCIERLGVTGKVELVCAGCKTFPLHCTCPKLSEAANVATLETSSTFQPSSEAVEGGE